MEGRESCMGLDLSVEGEEEEEEDEAGWEEGIVNAYLCRNEM